MQNRPSYRELDLKLKQGKEAAISERIKLLEPDAILADLLDLNYQVADLSRDLPTVFHERRPRDYRGQRPPQKSYEDPILDCDLFAFRWRSKFFGCQMYFKFAIKKEDLWIVSLHKDRSN